MPGVLKPSKQYEVHPIMAILNSIEYSVLGQNYNHNTVVINRNNDMDIIIEWYTVAIISMCFGGKFEKKNICITPYSIVQQF